MGAGQKQRQRLFREKTRRGKRQSRGWIEERRQGRTGSEAGAG